MGAPDSQKILVAKGSDLKSLVVMLVKKEVHDSTIRRDIWNCTNKLGGWGCLEEVL